MYNRVILAEKPDMGEKIAKALGISAKKRGYIELRNGDVVTWAIGHLIRLKAPDAYMEYKAWTWEALPVIPKHMDTEVYPTKIDQFNVVKQLLQNSKECIMATDPEREGEHIGRLILKEAGYQKKWMRLWIDDLTEATILNGMQNLKSSDDFTFLGDAALARSYADYWLGFTASRFFSLLAAEVTGGRANLSAGRVQTPTLRLVFDREKSMENFTAEPFYLLTADFQTSKGSYKGQWFKVEDDTNIYRFTDQHKAETMKKKLIGQSGSVLSYTEKEVNRSAPQLFNSSALKTASRKELGFSTVRTTAALQALYDKEYVSYPRVDSRHLSENKADELASHLNILREKTAYPQYFPSAIQSLKGKSRFVDDKKAATHHAIVPTAQDPSSQSDKLSADELKLYELILKHTLAAHHASGKDKEIEVITSVADETFYSRTIEIITPGWRAILKPDDDEPENKESQTISGKIPALENGMGTKTNSIDFVKGQTSKPRRLNDDELEKLMENAGRFVDENVDEGILEKIKEKGIGTPATRTNIVQSLVDREYIEITKNLVYLTNKGRSFMEMVYEHPIASIELTGEFEQKLGEVERGERPVAELLQEFKTYTHNILQTKDALSLRIEQLPQSSHTFENVEEIGACPKCGKVVTESPKLFGCSGKKEGCDFTIWKDFRSTTIKVKQAKDLLAGKEILIKSIPGKEDKKPYDLYIKIQEGKINTRFPQVEDSSLGNCPKCNKPVVEGTKSFGCSGWREGCKFAIWKSFRSTELTAKIVKSLLNGKEVLLQDLPSEKGTYELYVQLKDDKIDSRKPTAEDKSIGSCLLCKKPVVENEKSYGCSAWKEGCKFKLSKDFLGQKITVSQIKKLLKVGKTDKIVGLVGSKGPFDSALGYDTAANRYTFVK
ncbi:type IA DNA topoisomerase [Bacillus sp. FJAT-28004]|uniref:DNA topoisomerase n=1 Tax=Bacillus sp. FJAT-28004 TaxID=1679165 RepID=UPI0006B500FC|nr:type IA DNA topoisomerase [Bacillus sp. FJAT-28004]